MYAALCDVNAELQSGNSFANLNCERGLWQYSTWRATGAKTTGK
jgi:hypothetical protein